MIMPYFLNRSGFPDKAKPFVSRGRKAADLAKGNERRPS